MSTTRHLKCLQFTACLALLLLSLPLYAQTADSIILVKIADDKIATAGVEILERVDSGLYWVRVPTGPQPLPASLHIVGDVAEYRRGPEVARVLEEVSASRLLPVRLVYPLSFRPLEVKQAFSLVSDRFREARFITGNSVEGLVEAAHVAGMLAADSLVSLELIRPKVLYNRTAANQSGVTAARKVFSYTGDGIGIAVIDGGKIFSHDEFDNRLRIIDGGPADDHATHVGGTIGAYGLRQEAGGMAPDVMLFSYDFYGDVFLKMRRAKSQNNVVAVNNSWGNASGWEYEGGFVPWVWYGDESFGAYTGESRILDALIRSHNIIIVFACGNDRDNFGPKAGQRYEDAFTGQILRAQTYNPDGPFTSIGEYSSAKNVIAVGAIRDNGQMTEFSSWGPTKDGRIKPEITANGASVFSTVPGHRYDSMSGTSMAAPVVTGSLAVVAESWRSMRGGLLPPQVARALLAATARERGAPGPDYKYGFGVINVHGMVSIIEQSLAGEILRSTLVNQGQQWSATITVPDNKNQAFIALAWLDPPASAGAKSALVHDLDLAVTTSGNTTLLPYTLDPAKPNKKAATGVNERDNIELVRVRSARGNTYKITVTASRLLPGQQQAFAVVVDYR